MPHIFISYSRKDLTFAQKIVDALAANDLDTWIDWKSIPKGEVWVEEINRGIEEADAFLFLISPDSVVADGCNKEIDHAVRNGKRILPIVIRDADLKSIHPEISKRNWVFCRDEQDDFNKAIEETRKTIHTDYEWLKFHTNLQVKALKWEQKKDNSRLLRGRELREAEERLANIGRQDDPPPTKSQREYIFSSQRHEVRQRIQVTIGLGFGLVVAILLAGFAWNERNKAVDSEATAIAESNARATAQNNAEDSANARATALLSAENANATAQAETIRAEEQKRIAIARQLLAQSQLLPLNDGNHYIQASLLTMQSLRLSESAEGSQTLRQIAEQIGTIRQIIAPENGFDQADISRDGSMIVTAGRDSIRVWSASSAEEQYQIPPPLHIIDNESDGYINFVEDVDFSPDGKNIVVSGDYGASVIDVVSGMEISSFEYSTGFLESAFHPNGRWLVSEDWAGNAIIWDGDSGIELYVLDSPGDYGSDVGIMPISPDGTRVANGKGCVWDLETMQRLMCATSYGISVRFSPDSKLLVTSSYENTLEVWDIANKKKVFHYSGDEIYAFAFIPNSDHIVIGESESVEIWDFIENSKVREIPSGIAAISISISSDGQYALSSGRNNLATLWKVSTGEIIRVMPHTSDVEFVFFGSNSVITGGSELIRWDYLDNSIHRNYKEQPLVYDFSEDNSLLVTADLTGAVTLEEVPSGTVVTSFDTSISNIRRISLSPDHSLFGAASCEFGACNVDVFQTTTGSKIASLHVQGQVASISFSRSNRFLGVGTFQGELAVWDLTNDQAVVEENLTFEVAEVLFDPSESIVTSSAPTPLDRIIDFRRQISSPVIDLDTRRIIAEIAHGGNIQDILFLNDGTILSCGADGYVHHLDVQRTQNDPSPILSHESAGCRLASSSDDQWIAVGWSDGLIEVLNLETRIASDFAQHESWISGLAFSSSNRWLVSSGEDRTVRVLDLETGDAITRISNLDSADTVMKVMFSADDEFVITVDFSGDIEFWSWRTDDLITKACKHIPRNLTREEWAQYIGDALPYQAVCPNLAIEPEIIITPSP